MTTRDCPKILRSIVLRRVLWLLLVIVPLTAGCVSVPAHRAHADLPKRSGGIRTVGLVAPMVDMFEEQAQFGVNKRVPNDGWSAAAVETVSQATEAVAAAKGWRAVRLPDDDQELQELVALYGAVEYSIVRHSWDAPKEAIPNPEPFPEKVGSLEYSLGPVQELLERYEVDAVLFVSGFNLVPTPGAQVKEGVETLLAILAAMGGTPVPLFQWKKVELRVALVDRTGSVLYYGIADTARGGYPLTERARKARSMKGELDPNPTAEEETLAIDLRDPPVAAHYLKAALAHCRGEVAP